MAIVAVTRSLSGLETTREIRGLEPDPVFCPTAIKVSKVQFTTPMRPICIG